MRICPTCQQPWPHPKAELTEREMQLLAAWWETRSVSRAARQIGMAQQRAKNVMARARQRSGARTNDELLSMHVIALAERAMSHNQRTSEAA